MFTHSKPFIKEMFSYVYLKQQITYLLTYLLLQQYFNNTDVVIT